MQFYLKWRPKTMCAEYEDDDFEEDDDEVLEDDDEEY